MKTYYIPTSTLNFNNILSSESISPQAFYAKRGFGYSRWQSVEENGVDNAIILYDKPFEFVRPQSDVEDHPMLVKIVTDEELPKLAEGIYYCDHTIYLSSWWAKFIFFSERDKRTALSLSDSSLETKFMIFYRKCFDVQQGLGQWNGKKYNFNKVNIELNEAAIKRDRQINEMKGLLYGYYIGAMLSTSPENVATYGILQELQDIFSAVITSIDYKATPLQEERMNDLLSRMQEREPAIKYLKEIVKDGVDIDSSIRGLIARGVSFSFKDKSEIIRSLLSGGEEHNEAISWLTRKIEQLNKKIQSETTLLGVENKGIVVKDLRLSKISNAVIAGEMERSVVLAWVNEVFCSDEYSGSIENVKAQLSDEVTRKAKEVYENGWETCEMKPQLNEMRKYVRGADSSLRWGDNLPSVIAAVLSSGDDWEWLLRQMRLKSMCNYSLAFAIYGELVGFANLTRDFTDILFGYKDKQYVTNVYVELFGQLMGYSPVVEELSENQEIVSKDNKMHDAEKNNTASREPSNLLRKSKQNKQNLQGELKFEPEEPIQFSFQYIDAIIRVIEVCYAELTEEQLTYIKDDISYVIGKCKETDLAERLKFLRNMMNKIKKNPAEKTPKKKIELYRNVDVDRIIKCLEAKFVK